MIRAALSVFAVLSLSACVVTPPLPAEGTETQTSGADVVATSGGNAEVASLINAERAKVGLGPLSPDVHLSQLAREHADLMVQDNFFSHDIPGGLTYEQRMAAAGYKGAVHGENISYGKRDPSYTVADWMKSRGHKANILDRQYEKIGVGSARPYYWVTIFSDC